MTAMPPDLLSLVEAYYRQQQTTARNAAQTAQTVWAAMPATSLRDKWAWWESTGLGLVADTVALSQFTNATRSATYVAESTRLQGIDSTDTGTVNALAFVSATEDVEDWMSGAMRYTTALLVAGAPERTAKMAGLASLVRMTSTLAQDSGREAAGAGIAHHPALDGYIRHVRLPACKRCAVLAGGYFRWNSTFLRHPECDCVSLGTDKRRADWTLDADDAVKRGLVTGLSEADRQAILDGADVSQVVNAKRAGSVQTSTLFGRKIQTTTSGTTRRGAYGSGQTQLLKAGGRYRVAKVPRLTPSEIYRQADDKAHARRLLEKYGYIL